MTQFRHWLSILPLLFGLAPARAVGIGWQEAVARLAHERTRAETCVRLLKTYGDEGALRRGDLTYGEAKAEVDAVIAGLIVALAKEDDPASLPDLETRLERGVKGRETLCEQVEPLVPDATGEKNVIADLVAGAVGPLIEAAARAAVADANHFLYLAKANQLFIAGHGASLADALARIEAPTLIAADGTPVRRVEIAGTRGHLDGVLSLAQVGDVIEAFLKE